MAIVRNLATVKTTANITSSATSIPVNRTNVFGTVQNPLDNPFYVTIMPASGSEPANTTNSEIALVTGISGTNLIVTRGQRSTTARAFTSGAIVTNGIYAEDAVLLANGSASGSSTYRKKLVDKDGNTIIPIMGDIGPVYTASLQSASGGIATYTFTPDTPVESSRVYAVKFPTPTVNNATIILGDGTTSASVLVPPVAATDTPNYELLDTTMINDTEPLLLMYNGVQWVCLNQKGKVSSGDIDWPTMTFGNYSTSEQDTKLTWINGAKIYKKTVVSANLVTGENNINHGISNLGLVLKYDGLMDILNGTTLPIPTMASVTNNSVSVWIVNSTVVRIFSSLPFTGTVYITLYYTKTN